MHQALCRVRQRSLISRAASAARACEAASLRDVNGGATARSTRPNSRSAAAWKGRRWRGLEAVTFQLDTSPGHLECVLVELAAHVGD